VKLTVTLDGAEHVVEFDETYGHRSLEVDGQPHELTLLRTEKGRVRFSVDGRPVDATVQGDLPDLMIDAGDGPVTVRVEETRFARVRKISGLASVQRTVKDLMAPMPGLITRILVNAGTGVTAGTPLLVMEAMKMENELRAQGDGVVDRIAVEPGQAVDQGRLLIAFRPPDGKREPS
jgi:acetyl/propionyl-CoA carboxylase alpha subunit